MPRLQILIESGSTHTHSAIHEKPQEIHSIVGVCACVRARAWLCVCVCVAVNERVCVWVCVKARGVRARAGYVIGSHRPKIIKLAICYWADVEKDLCS